MADNRGYDKLTKYMTKEGYAIFRKFRVSATRDLLYQQAELVQLEAEFAAIANRDRQGNETEKLYDTDWRVLSAQGLPGCDGAQWAKALQIRAALTEYYASLAQYSMIAKLPQPRTRDRNMLVEWIQSPDLGGGIAFAGDDLCPAGTPVYSEMYAKDLLTFDDRTGENDLFSRLLAGPVFHTLERVWRRLKFPSQPPLDNEALAPNPNLFSYSDSHIAWFVNIIGTVLASMTPLVSIIILYFVRDLGSRLGVVCGCTFLFSTVLGIATKARRIEVFASTAAFASVQVVFISNTSDSRGQSALSMLG